MSMLAAAALLVLGDGPVMIVSAPEAQCDLGVEELAVGDDRAALAKIENCRQLPDSDPARQINHAVALARVGEYDAARDKFAAAARNADRFELETVTGDWVDSKVLARRGLAMIEAGDFTGYETLAVR